jgi:hypothetical protein
MDTGVCITCGAEDVNVNDDGKCEECGDTAEKTGEEAPAAEGEGEDME